MQTLPAGTPRTDNPEIIEMRENNRPEALAAGILACILLFTGVCVCCTNPAATATDPAPKGTTATDAVGGPEVPSTYSIQPQPKGYYGPIR